MSVETSPGGNSGIRLKARKGTREGTEVGQGAWQVTGAELGWKEHSGYPKEK